ncbi:MAG: hypothetical protein IJD52_00105 [Alphaproteobacteria bacterium]|nr:hypothetical protein [Alphaproteobacteria bacterium]
MAIVETLFDFISASVGAICGAVFAFFLNRRRNRRMASQQVVSRQALEKVKLENEKLLAIIQEKENMILQMQMQILGTQTQPGKKKTKQKRTI